MNSRLLAAFLALAALTPGCIIHDDDDWDDPCCDAPVETYPGDVTFRWTFGGLRCDEDRDIKGVNIDILAVLLANDGRNVTESNGFDGIVLYDRLPGTYRFSIQAVRYDDDTPYAASGTFSVNGDVTVDINTTPVGSPP